jgi:peptide/nickel transport system ATP-binding protein
MSRSDERDRDDADETPILSVRDLHVQFDTPEGTVQAVDGVSFDLFPGETVCLVGESGAGKTVTCEAITGLTPTPPGEITGGTVRFDGVSLLDASDRRLRNLRGNRIAYVFQHPQNALDPVYTIGEQLAEVVGYHRDVPPEAARERAIDLLDRVDIAKPANRLSDYPHELSGGMRQRVAIAMALASDPDVIVADEPTADLDVTIEAQILDLLRELQAERDLAIVYVTHDLGIVAGIADRVVVMYAGTVMERAAVDQLFDWPAHPYTQALLRSLPGHGELEPIAGSHPDPTDHPEGCRFHPRCPHVVDECTRGSRPDLNDVGGESLAACVFYRPDRDASVVYPDGTRSSSIDDRDGQGDADAEPTADPGTAIGTDAKPDAGGDDLPPGGSGAFGDDAGGGDDA